MKDYKIVIFFSKQFSTCDINRKIQCQEFLLIYDSFYIKPQRVTNVHV